MKRMIAAIAAVSALAAFSAPARAAWPDHPVRLIVPYGAGGAADSMARVFGKVLSDKLGQQIVVENRPGGGSMIGSREAAHAAPDGYTLAIVGMATHVLAPVMNKTPGFDPVKDFTQIAYLGGSPNLFVVHPSFGAKDFKEFMAKAKTADTIDYVSAGRGSVGNLVAEYLADKAHIKLLHVPFKGGAQAVLDLVAGHVKVGMLSASTASPQMRSGKLIGIGVTSAKRVPDMPDVPTFIELGYPDMVATTWWALAGPKGLPADIVAKVNAAINASLGTDEVKKSMAAQESQTQAMTPAEMTAFMQAEIAKWAPVAKKVAPH